ncbi:MAG: ribosome small subunit-dependent GTPase A [Lachnospiraceae bacterium]|nr:ribosome small subunit-dependent GTPase A [Lachnospiraceae bacterium]
MKGRILKGIGGFYYVHAEDGKVYECRARGLFRKDGIKPLTGDEVTMECVQDNEKDAGNIISLLPRRNELIRPAAANVDQAVIIFSLGYPEPDLTLLDKFLILMGTEDVQCVIAFNKNDMSSKEQNNALKTAYERSGCRVLFMSARTGEGLEGFRNCLEKKTSVLAGPSGVGKSSIVNRLWPAANMETGELSRKTGRGKNTTRHTEVFALGNDTYILDTPGFTSLSVDFLEPGELRLYYPEFMPFMGECRFRGCTHVTEPGCRVRQAVEEREVHPARYESYVSIYRDLDSEESRRKRDRIKRSHQS